MPAVVVKLGVLLAVAGSGLLLVAFMVVNKLSLQLVSHRFEIPEARPLSAWPDGDAHRGEHLVHGILGCVGCHGPDLAGRQLVAEPGRFRIASANIPRFAMTADLGAWERALRFGLRDDGRALWLMPQSALRHLSDVDLAAVAAYLGGVDPVDRDLPSARLETVGRVQVALGRLSLFDLGAVVDNRPQADPTPSQVPAPTATYGRYLARVGRCSGCHGAADEGAFPGALPWAAGPSLSPALAGMPAEALGKALRSGQTLAGSGPIKGLPFPHSWPSLADLEVAALAAHYGEPKAAGDQAARR